MRMRKVICLGDQPSQGGYVVPSQNMMTINEARLPMIFVGDHAFCNACQTLGVITAAMGKRRPTFQTGMALEGDLVSCHCAVFPTLQSLVAHQVMVEDEAYPSDGVLAPVENPALRLTESFNDKANEDCPHRIDGAVLVAEYIVEEIHKNANSMITKKIRHFISNDLIVAEWLDLPAWEKAITPIQQPSLLNALALWTKQVRTGGEWDHKPIIREKFRHVAIKNRPYYSTDESIKLFSSYLHKYKNHDYFYDVWSNIHYGYVGMVCGFSEDLLLDGAGLEQIADNRLRGKINRRNSSTGKLRDFDDIADRESVSLGIYLFNQFGTHTNNLTFQSILDGLENIQDLERSRLLHLCFDDSKNKITVV